MNARAREELEAQLSAYLDGELTAEQCARVENWLAQDPAAEALLADLRAVRMGLQALPRAQASSDLIENMRARLERRALLGDQGPAGEPARAPSLPGRRWVAAAAVIALTVVAGYVTWSFREPELPLAGERLASAPEPVGGTAFRVLPSEIAGPDRDTADVDQAISPSQTHTPAQPLPQRAVERGRRGTPLDDMKLIEPPPTVTGYPHAAVEPPATPAEASPSVAGRPMAAAPVSDGLADRPEEEGTATRARADRDESLVTAMRTAPEFAGPTVPCEQVPEGQPATLDRDEPVDVTAPEPPAAAKQAGLAAVPERPTLPVLANRAVSTFGRSSPSPEYGMGAASAPGPLPLVRRYQVADLFKDAAAAPAAAATSPATQPANAPASQPTTQPVSRPAS